LWAFCFNIYIYLNSSILGEGFEKYAQGVEGPPEKDPQVVEGPPERPSCFIQCWFVFTLKTAPFLFAHTLFIWFYKYEFCFFYFFIFLFFIFFIFFL
jgi:hypothetical protein